MFICLLVYIVPSKEYFQVQQQQLLMCLTLLSYILLDVGKSCGISGMIPFNLYIHTIVIDYAEKYNLSGIIPYTYRML